MSYILDALRRAERERHRDASDPVAEVAAATPPPPAPRRGGTVLILIGILILLLLAVNLVLLLRGRHPETAAQQARPSAATTPAAIISKQRAISDSVPQRMRSTATAEAPAHDHRSAVQAIPTLTPAGASSTESANLPASAPNPISGAAAIHSLSQLTPPSRPRRKAQAASTPIPATVSAESTTASGLASSFVSNARAGVAPPPTAPDEAPKTSLAATPPPSTPSGLVTTDLKMMPDNYRANFPQITIQVHVYDSDPAKCWVMIDGKRYRQGDTLPEGPKIDRIVPQGIVFDWQGRQVLYPT